MIPSTHGSIYNEAGGSSSSAAGSSESVSPAEGGLGWLKDVHYSQRNMRMKTQSKTYILTSLFENFRSKLLMESVWGDNISSYLFLLTSTKDSANRLAAVSRWTFPGEPQRGRRARAAFESEDGRVAVLRSDAPGARGIYARKCQEMSKNIAT